MRLLRKVRLGCRGRGGAVAEWSKVLLNGEKNLKFEGMPGQKSLREGGGTLNSGISKILVDGIFLSLVLVGH